MKALGPDPLAVTSGRGDALLLQLDLREILRVSLERRARRAAILLVEQDLRRLIFEALRL